MSTPLIDHLTEAWLFRSDKALNILRAAEIAPALFRPETVQQAVADYEHAIGWAKYWEVQR